MTRQPEVTKLGSVRCGGHGGREHLDRETVQCFRGASPLRYGQGSGNPGGKVGVHSGASLQDAVAIAELADEGRRGSWNLRELLLREKCHQQES